MTLGREETVAGLAAELADFEALVRALDERAWATPTRCDGWTVADVAAHVAGTLTDILAGRFEGLGSPDAIPEIFTKPAGTVFGPTSIGMYRVVGKVSVRIDPNLAELPAQTDSIREEIKKTKARERNALFEDGLRQQLTKDGKIKIHTDVLKRVEASYRG